jgi:hypothetical protein
MISLSEFRKDLFKIFAVLKDTGAEIKVYHRRKVYILSIRQGSEDDTRALRQARGYRKRMGQTLKVSDIDLHTCAVCNDLLVDGICMRKGCKNAMSHNTEVQA